MHWVGHILSRVARSIINMLLTLKSATPAVRSAARIYRCFRTFRPSNFPGTQASSSRLRAMYFLGRARASLGTFLKTFSSIVSDLSWGANPWGVVVLGGYRDLSRVHLIGYEPWDTRASNLVV